LRFLKNGFSITRQHHQGLGLNSGVSQEYEYQAEIFQEEDRQRRKPMLFDEGHEKSGEEWRDATPNTCKHFALQ
jgi:hypothetical protein